MVEPYFLCIPRDSDIEKVFVSCILCVEVTPNNFDFIVLANARNIDVTFKANTSTKRYIQKIFFDMLKRLNSEKIGVQNKVFKIKIGSGKNKKYIKLNKIVYIKPKKEVTENFISKNKNIDWSYKWLVRGHWRKVDGIGKNREGLYNTSGYTWVKEHEKGDGELVIKQRRII